MLRELLIKTITPTIATLLLTAAIYRAIYLQRDLLISKSLAGLVVFLTILPPFLFSNTNSISTTLFIYIEELTLSIIFVVSFIAFTLIFKGFHLGEAKNVSNAGDNFEAQILIGNDKSQKDCQTEEKSIFVGQQISFFDNND